MSSPAPFIPRAHDARRIAAAAAVDPRTVRRAYLGKPIAGTTAARIAVAVASLGLPPPPPSTAERGES